MIPHHTPVKQNFFAVNHGPDPMTPLLRKAKISRSLFVHRSWPGPWMEASDNGQMSNTHGQPTRAPSRRRIFVVSNKAPPAHALWDCKCACQSSQVPSGKWGFVWCFVPGGFPSVARCFPARVHRSHIFKPHRASRIGSDYGGWTFDQALLGRHSVVYSIGLGKDISFDLHLINKTRCHVHGFDDTPVSTAFLKKQKLPPHFHWHRGSSPR